MDAEARQAIQELKAGLHELYGDRLRGVILYGSHARGDATKESDIDILVVLKGPVAQSAEIDRMAYLVGELNLLHHVLLAVVPVSEEAYRTVQSPLLMNVRREGIPA